MPISHYQWSPCYRMCVLKRSAVKVSVCKEASWIWGGSLKHTHTNPFQPTHLPTYTLNVSYKAIRLQSSRGEVGSVFTVCLSETERKKQRNLLKHNVAPWWQAAVLQIFSSFSLLPSAVLFIFLHTGKAIAVKSEADLRKILHSTSLRSCLERQMVDHDRETSIAVGKNFCSSVQ